ncbi:MAG: hypothetical protein FWC91_05440 [Defluviitaleaceae bacterium]|nr:hypothetical protein [Defluviitaleaceae bacterium]
MKKCRKQPQSTLYKVGDTYMDNNEKLLASLLDEFDDEFDKLEFISRLRDLAEDMRDGNNYNEKPIAYPRPKLRKF